MVEVGRIRIGELSRRVGESPEVLRAWETRYGLVAPQRTPGGLRLYSDQDERRIGLMQRHIAAGLSAAEAARLAKQADESRADSSPDGLADIRAELERSFDRLDEPAAQAAVDRLLVGFELQPALAEGILPVLHRLGTRWAAAEVSVAHEHFASNIIGGRLRELARGWGQGVGPRAILACPPGELHELGLLSFGLVLRDRGWRITYLGADTPLDDIAAARDELAPSIVVLAAMTAQRFLDSADELSALAARGRVGLAGAGASVALAGRLGAEPLTGEVVRVAAALTP
jgi:DNA-binding transcriptional MerR regulator